MKNPSVCAIVLTYNGRHLIGRMLESVRKTKYDNWHVVVVDNGSSDGSGELVKEKFPWAELLRLQPNRGFGGGNNIGMRHALKKYHPDYIIWLNDDMEIVDPQWLRVLVETAERRKAGITGCKLVLPDGRIQFAGGYFHPIRITLHRGLYEKDDGQYDDEREVDYVNGACFLIAKEVLARIGMVDEGYYPIYFEEADYCARARKAGFPIVYTGKTRVVHYTSTTMKREGADRRYFIWEKNRLRFIRKNFPLPWRLLAYGRIMAGVGWVRKDSMGYGTTIGERWKLMQKAWNEAEK